VPLGHLVFGPDNLAPTLVSGAIIVWATFSALFLITRSILQRSGDVTLETAALFSVLACLPGLILDGTLYAFNAGHYPGLNSKASGIASETLLYTYAAALLGALYAARLRRTAQEPTSAETIVVG
jgi:hypothetical protein